MARPRELALLALLLIAVSASGAVSVPSDQTVEATGPSGAIVNYSAEASGSGDDENGRPMATVACAPASGSEFAIGETTVSCTASNGGIGNFKVKVVDTTAPALTLPRDFTVAGSSSGTVVTFQASATDIVDGPGAVSCSPSSGSVFGAGMTTVNCTTTDSHQNEAAGSFIVTVTAPDPPPPPPVPNDITVEATGPAGAVVTFNSGGGNTGGDDENGRPANSSACSPASGSTFPLGSTTVQCTGGSFEVTVVDTTAPSLSVPADIHVTTSASGTQVIFTASANDLVDGSVGVSCTPPSGATFPVGTTLVQCSATDAHQNSANDSFQVIVHQSDPSDTEAPVIVSLSASPDTLKPPNGKMIEVTIAVTVTDNGNAAPAVQVFDITSNESLAAGDAEITGPLTVELRAKREGGGSGRVYTIWVEAIDAAGNRSVGTVDVTVQHDGGNSSPAVTQPAPKRRTVRGG